MKELLFRDKRIGGRTYRKEVPGNDIGLEIADFIYLLKQDEGVIATWDEIEIGEGYPPEKYFPII